MWGKREKPQSSEELLWTTPLIYTHLLPMKQKLTVTKCKKRASEQERMQTHIEREAEKEGRKEGERERKKINFPIICLIFITNISSFFHKTRLYKTI